MNKTLLLTTAKVYFLKLAIVVIGFAIVAGLARNVEPSALGDYFWLLSFASVAAVVLRFGRDNLLVKQMANAVELERHRFVKQALGVVLKLSVVHICIVLSLYFTEYITLKEKMLGIAMLPPLVAVLSVFGYWAQAAKQAELQQLLNAAPRLLSGIAVLFALWFYDYTVSLSIALIFTAVSVALLCITYLFVSQPAKSDNHLTQADSATEVLRSAPNYARYLMIALCSTIMMEGAVLLAGLLTEAAEVAKLAVVMRIVSVVSFILLAFNAVLMPEFAVLAKRDNAQDIRMLFQKSRNVSLLSALFVAMLVLIIHKPVLSFFGQFFESSNHILFALLCVQLVKVVVGPTGQLLMMSGYERIQQYSLMFSCVSLTVFGLTLIPTYGALGAAYALLIAVSVNNFTGLYFCVKHYQVPWLPFVKVRSV
ncbi:oligosaccharide flippase family protein [Pseudoalteromonas xiamenensis]|uniref:oligosaccharide flippase family protein n=1 Tax=Pseudoalteromonas xiamenensis TaxID=882626 RepID=UPI0035ED2120